MALLSPLPCDVTEGAGWGSTDHASGSGRWPSGSDRTGAPASDGSADAAVQGRFGLPGSGRRGFGTGMTSGCGTGGGGEPLAQLSSPVSTTAPLARTGDPDPAPADAGRATGAGTSTAQSRKSRRGGAASR